MGHLFIAENILGSQSLDVELKCYWIGHSLPVPTIQSSSEVSGKQTLMKAKQIKIQDFVEAKGKITASVPSFS